MAIAQTRTCTRYEDEQVTITRLKAIDEKEIILTLNEAEAQVLAQILSKVGGDPDGVRGDAKSVLCALEDAGVFYYTTYFRTLGKHEPVKDHPEYRLDGAITFVGADLKLPSEKV